MVDCLGLDFDHYERKIQRIIKTQKNKISNLTELEGSTLKIGAQGVIKIG